MHEFVCDKCNCIDLLELSYPEGRKQSDRTYLCTECRFGKWHGYFIKEEYKGQDNLKLINKEGLSLG